MKKILCLLLAAALLAGIGCALADAANGEPYGDGDGVISHERLAGLYRWMIMMDSSFWKQLTFDDIGAAAGAPGHDRNNGDGKTHGAEWRDEEGKYYVVVTFRYDEELDVWRPTSVSTGLNSAEYSVADISDFPHVGNREAGASPAEPVAMEIPVTGTDRKAVVTVNVPAENWYTEVSFSCANYYLSANEEKARYTYSSVSIALSADASKHDRDVEKYGDLTELGPVTVAGMELQACSYDKNTVLEYYGFLPDGETYVRIVMKEIIPFEGTEAEALIGSLQIEFTE